MKFKKFLDIPPLISRDGKNFIVSTNITSIQIIGFYRYKDLEFSSGIGKPNADVFMLGNFNISAIDNMDVSSYTYVSNNECNIATNCEKWIFVKRVIIDGHNGLSKWFVDDSKYASNMSRKIKLNLHDQEEIHRIINSYMEISYG